MKKSSLLKPSSMVSLATVKQKWHTAQMLLNILMFAGEKKTQKANENNDLILYLFYSKTAGTNPAFKDYC